MKNIARSLVLLVGLLAGSCAGDDDGCEGTKPGGAECFSSCECKSGYCISTTRECLGSGSKPEESDGDR